MSEVQRGLFVDHSYFLAINSYVLVDAVKANIIMWEVQVFGKRNELEGERAGMLEFVILKLKTVLSNNEVRGSTCKQHMCCRGQRTCIESC